MSCCPGPERGKPFDPDAELPCEADMARFGDEEDESSDYFDDEITPGASGYGREAHAFGSPRQGGVTVVAKVLIGAMLVAACAGLVWIAR